MKKFKIVLVLLVGIGLWFYFTRDTIDPNTYLKKDLESIYSFKVTDINGKTVDFETFRGKKIMIVNVASKCGLTPQYKGLQQLYDRYKDSGFEIIAFPSNSFFWREPGADSIIKKFCKSKYGVSFSMMSKISVKGDKIHPIFEYLTTKSKNGLNNKRVKWNFQKYLIGRDGYLEKVISTGTKPMDKQVVDWINN